MSGNSQIYGRQDMDDRKMYDETAEIPQEVYDKVAAEIRRRAQVTPTLDELKAILSAQSRDRTPEEAGFKTDLYGDVADKLGVTREEAKARALAEAYGLVRPSALEQVAQFHARFSLPGLEQDATRDLTDEEALFRVIFMLEELAEYAECSGLEMLANELAKIGSDVADQLKGGKDETGLQRTLRSPKRDRHGQLDALVDLSYVLHGTAVMQGFRRFDEAFAVVHRANMTKVRADSPEASKRGTSLDVVKPKGWSPPVLTEFL